MKLYIYEDYKSIYPDLKGQKLTDQLIKKSLKSYGCKGQITIKRTNEGKPYVITDTDPANRPLHISLSHSDNVLACLVAPYNVGIDIQKPDNANYEKIAARYFANDEQEIIKNQGKDGFFRLWTRKEAYAKYTGKGLSQILKGVSVAEAEDVVFEERILSNGMYCCICKGAI